MPAKIRLTRRGKKGNAFFHIVVADGRAPRDGKFVEKIGTYDPNSNPATIVLDNDKALSWLQKGAQPTDTARAILSYKGVLYKNHLAGGVQKGALTQELADAKYEAWLTAKEGKITDKRKHILSGSHEAAKARLAAETKAKDEKAKAVAAKATPPAPVAETHSEDTAAPEASNEASAPAAEV